MKVAKGEGEHWAGKVQTIGAATYSAVTAVLFILVVKNSLPAFCDRSKLMNRKEKK
jgi:hypothetical protein